MASAAEYLSESGLGGDEIDQLLPFIQEFQEPEDPGVSMVRRGGARRPLL